MNVLEFLNSQPVTKLSLRGKQLYPKHPFFEGKHGIFKVKFALQKLESQYPERTNISARVHYDKDMWSVSGSGPNGEVFSIVFNPWGEWREMEVEIDGDITELDAAVHILAELTYMGPPEEQQAKAMSLQEMIPTEPEDMSDFIEISPGVMVTPSIAAQMEKSGELNEILRNLTFEDFKKGGRDVGGGRMFAKKQLKH